MEGPGKEPELRSVLKMKMNRFFKLILQKEPLQELKIPPKFARLFFKELPCGVILKGPSGECWNAKLRKDITGMYIHDGWQKFHIDNSLGNKEFLLFECDGKRSFEVYIFDPTGLKRTNAPVTKIKETNLHSGKRPRGRPRKYPVGSRNLPPFTYPNSQNKQNLEVEPNKLEKKKEEEEEMNRNAVRMSSKPPKNKQRSKLGKPPVGLLISKSRIRCRPIEKKASRFEVNARLRAVEKMFTSSFPYFMTCMKMPSLEKARVLYITKAFAQVHFPQERADIVLRNPEGNTWNVACVVNKNRHFFSAGWITFVRDNKLGDGDVCVFTLLSATDFVVHIFRSPETLTT